MKSNDPNLFRRKTLFFINLHEKSNVTIELYDENETKLLIILEKQELSKGKQEIKFTGNQLKSGMYNAKIIIENTSETVTENRIIKIK